MSALCMTRGLQDSAASKRVKNVQKLSVGVWLETIYRHKITNGWYKNEKKGRTARVFHAEDMMYVKVVVTLSVLPVKCVICLKMNGEFWELSLDVGVIWAVRTSSPSFGDRTHWNSPPAPSPRLFTAPHLRAVSLLVTIYLTEIAPGLLRRRRLGRDYITIQTRRKICEAGTS